MATFQLAPPENFDFNKPNDWPKWIQRFERFRVTSQLDTKEGPLQVNTLVYSMGPKADDILPTLNLTADQLKVYDNVKKAFENHFIIRRNVIFERAKFNNRKQLPDESVDCFITALYGLAEHCNYGALREEMIRDRIVVGLKDEKLSEKLQLDAELTLQKAVNLARQSEEVKSQQSTIRNPSANGANVDAVRKKNPRKSTAGNRKKPAQTQSQTVTSSASTSKKYSPSSKCSWCGRQPNHNRDKCPAKDVVCHSCEKVGHFAKVCRSSQSANKTNNAKQKHKSNPKMDDLETEIESLFLGEVNVTCSKPWTVDLTLGNSSCEDVRFKVDTGADVTAIPEKTFRSIFSDSVLQPADRVLYGPGRTKLETCGQFTTALHLDSNRNGRANHRQSRQQIYVVKNLTQALLGRPAIEALHVISRANLNYVNDAPRDKLAEYKEKFPKLFSGLGKIPGKYHIDLKPDAKPYAITTPRNLALPLIPKVGDELKSMHGLDVIRRVDEPTDWCAPMVVVPKPCSERVRICVDLSRLNESVRRELHPLPSVDQVLGQLKGAKVFSKLDANSGFWQAELDEESQLLTTFMTPFGRFCFKRLPFGISSAPEYFQKQMQKILSGLEGVVCEMDDILVFGEDQKQHDRRLLAVLRRLEKAGVTLNADKCVFSVRSVKFVGHIVGENGIGADPLKVKAIVDMDPPTNVSELRRFLGMVNQLSKFTLDLAETTKPMRDLLSKGNQWLWGTAQEQAFQKVKSLLSSTPVLAMYDPQAETMVSSDASSFGLGALLAQKQSDGQWRPVAYASRSMSRTEQRYAQIEKEALAITWACQRFNDYILGLPTFHIQTDHKPLIPLLGSKSLDELPPRIQRFRMKLMRYSYTISHVPGKNLITPDALSRTPVRSSPSQDETTLQEEATAYLNAVYAGIPASTVRLEQIRKCLSEDDVSQILMHYVRSGWPDKHNVHALARPYWSARGELSIHNGLLLKGTRIFIPEAMRSEMRQKVHEGHLGVTKCRRRAKETIWWPGLSREIYDLVKDCKRCRERENDRAEPLITTELPQRPWQKVGTDLLEWKNANYLVLVDYYSRYVELARLFSTTSNATIRAMKPIFARHGVPETLISDNGPQYIAEEFQEFANDYDFSHITSSPRYPQSNGEAERAVQTVKELLEKNDDPHKALLAYRSTPLENGYSPAELLFSRRIRGTVPILPDKLNPSVPDSTSLRTKEVHLRDRQKRNFDNRHRVVERADLEPGSHVFVKDFKTTGKVVSKAHTPRSYVVETPSGEVRRNRRHLVKLSESQIPQRPNPVVELEFEPPSQPVGQVTPPRAPSEVQDTPRVVVQSTPTHSNVAPAATPQKTYQTKSGRTVKPPTRLDI